MARVGGGEEVGAGALGGFFGGLFSISGPPVVYQFYRQPVPAATLRLTLVALFSLTSMGRLAVVAENATRGTYPRRQLEFLAPEGPFKVVERGEALYVDPVSYDRYDRYVEVLEGIDPGELAGLIETIEPLLAAALGELGVEAPADQVFDTALAEVMAVPVLSGDVELVQPNVMYHYADPDLEALSPLQKQVLRMGPDNVRRLQDHLREVAGALELAP